MLDASPVSPYHENLPQFLYSDNHCKEEELSNDLPRSYKMRELFHRGRQHPMKIRAGFYTAEGYGSWLFLVFWCTHQSGYHSCAFAPRNKEGPQAVAFSYVTHNGQLLSGSLFIPQYNVNHHVQLQ